MQITTKSQAVETYYRELAELRGLGATHEQATRAAFEHLLTAFARPVAEWTLVLEQRLANGRVPDGTLRDAFNLPRGYWEAKDTGDDLTAEIKKKIGQGYPTINTIFEDTRRGVLYQGGRVQQTADLSKPAELVDLLRAFFGYTEPEIAGFEQAVREFKERIPELAEGLKGLIRAQYTDNTAFRNALAGFWALCRTSLDPNISMPQVEEMLVQHLLTERLFRTVFQNPDFTRRNVIAAEIETVIDALTSRAFNRGEFLRSLDRFYVAIEAAAKGLEDWSEKQAFMNVVYERFFQGYSVKTADTHGIVYTPQEIVDFMCASVEEVLRREFGRSLSDKGVQILDPCTGTGSFVVNLLRRISGTTLAHKYAHDLFANEIMLLPYYIASLNIEHAYYERTGEYKPFDGLCFTDTLELAEGRQMQMFVERNSERVEREKAAEIMVVIGNPPYNVGQMSENDNNKNRPYPVVDARIRETYAKDSKATLKNKLSDAYVKFFRWATDRLGDRDGIVCFVTNNSFVDQIAFDGMRKHLSEDFTTLYHVDLHGDVRKNPKISGTSHNVFGIQVGVGITVAVRHGNRSDGGIHYYRVAEDWRRERKTAFLAAIGGMSGIEWQELEPDDNGTWLTEGMQPEFARFLPLGTKATKAGRDRTANAIFKTFSLGVATNRDEWTYDFSNPKLGEKIQQFVRHYNLEVFRWSEEDRSPQIVDSFVNNDPTFLKWTDRLKDALVKRKRLAFDASEVRVSLYRPFCKQYLYFDHLLNQRRYQQHIIFPTALTEIENTTICVSTVGHRAPFTVLGTNIIPNLALNSTDGAQCFPLYTYAEDGSNRRENVTDWALEKFRAAYGEDVTKRDIFDYVYAVLHHPAYRERYAENLKRELPRIPLLPSRADFETCVRIGRALAELHLNYESAEEYPLRMRETPGERPDWRVKKMRLVNEKTALVYNDWLTLEGIPAEVYKYRLGNRPALEWVIDQYQVSTDARSGITSDPNRREEPEYIVRLVKRVVTVSVETVKLVGELAREVDVLAAVGVRAGD